MSVLLSLNYRPLLESMTTFCSMSQPFPRVNIQIPTPEIVFIGPKGHGKSSLLEALLGHYFNIECTHTIEPRFLNFLQPKPNVLYKSTLLTTKLALSQSVYSSVMFSSRSLIVMSKYLLKTSQPKFLLETRYLSRNNFAFLRFVRHLLKNLLFCNMNTNNLPT